MPLPLGGVATVRLAVPFTRLTDPLKASVPLSATVTGLVVPASDPGALREAMGTLWRDDALTTRLAADARTRFETLFRADKMVDAYVDLYRRLVARAR